MNKFKQLGIQDEILKAIDAMHITDPTTIQAKAIPLVLKGKDVIGGSKTGSGKTLAFAAGIIQNITEWKGIQALVLVPTRELAEQVARAFIKFAKHKKVNTVTVYGGVSINPQIDALQRADVVIGTPGRILDHIGRETINLKHIQTLVLDEADMMLDMGFLPDVEKIIREVPKKRQTLLFSATISTDINELTRKHMHSPTKVSVEEYVDPTKLKQTYIQVKNQEKFSLLVQLLQKEKEGLVMVFCNTRQNTDFLAKNLKANGIRNIAIHGGLTQNRRNQVIHDFHTGRVTVLICTDVAARGLDIKGVSHVYNYDTCSDPKQYIHRIGRTARAGKDGKAITLLAERDYDNFNSVLQTHDVKIPKEETPKIMRAKIVFKTNAKRRGDFGRGRPQFGQRSRF